MHTSPSPDPMPRNRERLIAVGVFLALLIVLLVLRALGFWGGGEMASRLWRSPGVAWSSFRPDS